MPIFEAIILGLIQGLTEFIPISSSGHLVLVRELFGWEDTGIAFDTVLHLGTLLAVIIYFWSTWKSLLFTLGRLIARKETKPENKFLLLALIIGTLPALAIGYFFNESIDQLFRDISWVAIFLIATGVLFVIAERARRWFKKREEQYGQKKFKDLGIGRALFIGCMQAVALLPGVSRSGLTIAGGIFSGLTREAAARFAFMLSVPIILAAGILGLIEMAGNGGIAEIGLASVIIGFIVAAASGYLAIKFMLRFLRQRKLYIFSIYLMILGVTLLVLGNL
ncbi:undecaprenyl-diphosphatase UppP [Patescibacteria group bacterium]